MFTLKNENIEFSLDTQGKLVHLLNRQTGRDYAGGTPLWRIICSYGRCQEEEIPAENSIAEVQQPAKDTLKLQIVNPRSGETKFRITITIHLKRSVCAWRRIWPITALPAVLCCGNFNFP